MGDTMPLPMPGLDDTRATPPTVAGRSDELLDLLAAIGVEPRASLLVVGCGDGELPLGAAGLVGPRGRVLAVDSDGPAVDALARHAAARALGQLEVRRTELERFAPDGIFDLVLVRLRSSASEPDEIELRRHARSVRPGGVLALLDVEAKEPSSPGDGRPATDSGAAFSPVSADARPERAAADATLPWLFGRAGLPAPRLRLAVGPPQRVVAAWSRL